MLVIETYPPEDRGVFKQLEEVNGIRTYITYPENGIYRAVELSILLDHFINGKLYNDRPVNLEDIKYVKQKLDEALKPLYD